MSLKSIVPKPVSDARAVHGPLPSSTLICEGRVLVCDGVENHPRWREGERLEEVFEGLCDQLAEAGRGQSVAVDGATGALTFTELDQRANQLARFLARGGELKPGMRVGLLFDRAVEGYVAMLATLKLRCAYVPLDPGFPPERNAFIAQDAGVGCVLSLSHLADRLAELDERVGVIHLDHAVEDVAAQAGDRLSDGERGQPADDLCYVIYTSGTTGRPKGVPIRHRAMCNFVRVACEIYGYEPGDRVYQGLTLAFDFSVEEIWVPWMAGATLIPKPGAENLLGPELHEFLAGHRATALCCVPTLLGTLDEDLPELRLLIVSGESCPADLVKRWSRPGRRFLNVYGPTEATVSATWTLLQADRPVRIGVPLPTYSIVIVDPDEDRALDPSQTGEIAIAGIGLADGYLARPEATERAFIDDFLGVPGNPSACLYRTGDLGRVDERGELEHLGRIDTQVKIRGYRIELEEVESVLRSAPGIKHAVVGTHQSQAGEVELAAYYVRDGADVEADRVFAILRERLPPFMVPAYLERLEEIPLMPSGKVDRSRLPPPSGPRAAATDEAHAAAETDLEALLADQLAQTLGVGTVSVEAHFFEDLGATSLLMGKFAARLRKETGGPAVSMRNLYLHPTVRSLAEAVSGGSDGAARADSPSWTEPELPEPTGTPRQVLCGTLQFALFLLTVAAASLLVDLGATWLSEASGALSVYVRALAFGAVLLFGLGVAPIALKWALIGRFQRQRIRVWSLAYVRFWIVKTALFANPLPRLCAGTPLYSLYLRALGADIGRGVTIFTRHVPVCTDLLRIGDGTVIRADTFLTGYRARAGVIEIGGVSLGARVFVGERSFLDIDTEIEDGGQIGHCSSLHAGQVVPAGECWHGSPAEPAGSDYDYGTVPLGRCGSVTRAVFTVTQVLSLAAVVGPIEAALMTLLLAHPGFMDRLPEIDSLWIAAAILFGLIALALVIAGTVPRLLGRLLVPGKVYPLFGGAHFVQRLVAATSNITPLTALFGDSSAIVGYLRLLGYRLGVVEQTGSNFGMVVKHGVPTMCEVGTGTMVADGLTMMNAEFSSSAFRLMPVTVGRHNYLGNLVSYPAESRAGDNCLLATKVLVPIAGRKRENVGLLGSPSFEIPRSAEPAQYGHLHREPERTRRLAAKTRHNVVTMGLHLLVWLIFLAAVIAIGIAPLGGTGIAGLPGTVLSELLDVLIFPLAFFVLVERAAARFRRLEPRRCSIYERPFWRHERYWKVPSIAFIRIFDGTPVKPLVWRAMGAKMGRRVFDDGCRLVERTLVEVGDDCTLGLGSTLHCHSMEDAVFKLDRITIGDRCTVGTGAFVHYDVTLEDDSMLETDSFVMKGSRVPAGARWRGNPAADAQ